MNIEDDISHLFSMKDFIWSLMTNQEISYMQYILAEFFLQKQKE